MGIFKQRCAMPIKQTKPGIYMELGQFLDLIEWEALFALDIMGFIQKCSRQVVGPQELFLLTLSVPLNFRFISNNTKTAAVEE